MLDVLLLEMSADYQEDEQLNETTMTQTSVDDTLTEVSTENLREAIAEMDAVDSAVPTLLAVDSLVVPPTNFHNLSLFSYFHMAMPDVPPPLARCYDDL